MSRYGTSPASADAAAGESGPETSRARVLLGAALGPVVCGYAVVATVLTVVTVLAPQGSFSVPGVLAASGPAWLAGYQVPVELSGSVLGVLPLLPTIGAGLLVARAASGAVHRLAEYRSSTVVTVVLSVVGTHAVMAAAVIALSAGTGVVIEPFRGMLTPVLLSGVCATAGVVHAWSTSSRTAADRWRDRFDPVAVQGVRAGLLGLAALLTAGAVAVLVATLSGMPRVTESLAVDSGAGGGAGMLLLSLGYLPNTVLLGLGFVTGPGFSVGLVSVSPFALTPGPVPPVAMLAGMPEQYTQWWLVLLGLPAVAGVLVGRSVRDVDERLPVRLRAVVVAGLSIGLATVVLGSFAGGSLGGGVFDPVSMRVEWVSVAACGWIIVFGGITVFLAGPRGRAVTGRGRERRGHRGRGHPRSAPRR